MIDKEDPADILSKLDVPSSIVDRVTYENKGDREVQTIRNNVIRVWGDISFSCPDSITVLVQPNNRDRYAKIILPTGKDDDGLDLYSIRIVSYSEHEYVDIVFIHTRDILVSDKKSTS